MGSSKTKQNTNDYYGDVAGVICQGQLDFIWGLLVNNNLAWPDVKQWDFNGNNGGKTYIWTDGNAYKASQRTGIDPPSFPWILKATAYSPGAYLKNAEVVFSGEIWKATVNTSQTIPAASIWKGSISYAIGDKVLAYIANGVLGVWQAAVANKNSAPNYSTTSPNLNWTVVALDWLYESTPTTWADTAFWDAGTVVAWLGQMWVTAKDTNTEPGIPGSDWTLWKVNRTDTGTHTADGSGTDNTYTAGNPLKATAVNYGDFFIYWGTADQQLDEAGDENYLKSLSPLSQLPYRNKALIVLQNFDFGTEQTTPPSIQVLGGRNPVQSLITGPSALLDGDWQANPWCVLAELLTHPVIGLGLPASWFDLPSWQREADFIANNTELYYISPIYTDLRKVREIVQDLLGYPDAFVFWNTVGALSVGHWPHGTPPPVWTTANTINRDNLTEEIPQDSNMWGDTQNSVAVSYQDVQTGFRNRPVYASNLFNNNVVKQLQAKTVDRPHITRYAQAVAWAAEFAKLAGDQQYKGDLVIQAEKAADVGPGSIFLLTDDVLDTSTPQRCTSVTVSAPPKGLRKITYQLERGISPQPYAPTEGGQGSTTAPVPTRITNYAILELPVQITTQTNAIAILAGRNDAVTSSAQIWYQAEDVDSFTELATIKGFAVPGLFDIGINSDETLTPYGDTAITTALGQVTQGNNYSVPTLNGWQAVVQYANNAGMSGAVTATVGTDYVFDPVGGVLMIVTGGAITTGMYVTIKVWNAVVFAYDVNTPALDLEGVSSSVTLDQFNDGDILLVAIQANNPGVYELMTVGAVTAGGTGTLTTPVWVVNVQRAQFGTLLGGDGSYVWGTNPADQIFIIQKSQFNALFAPTFADLAAANEFMNVLLVPANAFNAPDVSDIYDPASNPLGTVTETQYYFVNPFIPQGVFNLLLQNGVQIDFATITVSPTDVFNFSFTVTDALGELTEAALVAVGLGQQETTLWSSTFPATDFKSQSVTFSIPIGQWAIQLRMWNNAEYDAETSVIYDGTPFLFNAGGSANSPVPTLFRGRKSGNSYVEYKLQAPVIAGLQVYYQTQPTGTPLNPGSWITAIQLAATGSITNWQINDVIISGHALYAFSTASFLADSLTASWLFK